MPWQPNTDPGVTAVGSAVSSSCLTPDSRIGCPRPPWRRPCRHVGELTGHDRDARNSLVTVRYWLADSYQKLTRSAPILPGELRARIKLGPRRRGLRRGQSGRIDHAESRYGRCSV